MEKRVIGHTKKIISNLFSLIFQIYFHFKKNIVFFNIFTSKKLRIIAVALCSLFFALNMFFLPLNYDISFSAPKKAKSKITKTRKIEEKTPIIKKPEGVDKNTDDVLIYKKGLGYYETGEYIKACEYFKYIYEMFPKSFYYDTAIYFMGESYNKTGKFDDAVGAYALVIKHCPGSTLAPEALHNIAVIYRKKGVNAEAIKYYKFLIDEYPESFWVEEAQSFVKYQKISREVPETPAVSLKTIDKAPKIGQFEEIKIDETQINLKDGDSKQYQIIKYGDADLSDYKSALSEHERGYIEKAKVLYQKMIIKYKNSLWTPNAYYMLGNCYLATGDLKAAIRFYSASLIYCKERTLRKEIMYKLADLLYVDGQYRLALRYYEVLAESCGGNESSEALYYLIGDCNFKLGNNEDAARAYAKIALNVIDAVNKTKAAAVIKNEQAPVINETAANELKETRTSAETELIRSRQANADLKITPLSRDYLDGMEYFNSKNYIKAISKFEKCMSANPENSVVMWHLALCYQQVEKFEMAIEYLQKYIVKIPESKEARSLLAYIYSRQGKFDDACAEYLKIISMDPGSGASQSAHDAIKRIEMIKNRLEREKNDAGSK